MKPSAAAARALPGAALRSGNSAGTGRRGDRATLLRELARLGVAGLRVDEPLARHARWQVGGPADVFIDAASAEELGRVLRWTHERGLPLTVIGDGTNLLFADAGIRGIVVKVGRGLSRLAIEGRAVRAEAGVWVPALARRVGCAGLVGIEHTVGIPGTLGGLVVMNGGSQRKGIGDNVRRVLCLDRAGERLQISGEACGFAYRRSSLQGSGLVVAEVELELAHGDAGPIRRAMIEIMAGRRRKFPLKLPNCGSVFLSDPKMYATVGPPGAAIERCGLKGLRRGNAQVSIHHANFIVNLGGARAVDILWLIHRVRSVVRARTDYWLDCEVRYVAPDGGIDPAHQAAAAVWAEVTGTGGTCAP